MLNKGLHSERTAGSRKTKAWLTVVLSLSCYFDPSADGEKSVTEEPGNKRSHSAFGLTAHGSWLAAKSYVSPKNHFAYETTLTLKEVRYTISAAQLLSNLPSGETQRGAGKHLILYNQVPITNKRIEPTLIVLHNYQTQTERINTNKNRIGRNTPLNSTLAINNVTICQFFNGFGQSTNKNETTPSSSKVSPFWGIPAGKGAFINLKIK